MIAVNAEDVYAEAARLQDTDSYSARVQAVAGAQIAEMLARQLEVMLRIKDSLSLIAANIDASTDAYLNKDVSNNKKNRTK